MNFGFVESTSEIKCQLNLYFTLICKAMKDCSCGLPFPCDHCNPLLYDVIFKCGVSVQ